MPMRRAVPLFSLFLPLSFFFSPLFFARDFLPLLSISPKHLRINACVDTHVGLPVMVADVVLAREILARISSYFVDMATPTWGF